MNIYPRFALLTLSTILLPFVISCSTLPTDSYRYRSSSLYNDPVSYDNWHNQTFNQTVYPSDFYGDHYKSGGYKHSSFGNTHHHRTTPQQQYQQAGMENQRLQAEYQQQAAQAQIEQQRMQAEYQQQAALAQIAQQQQAAQVQAEQQRMQAEYQQQVALAQVAQQQQAIQAQVEQQRMQAEYQQQLAQIEAQAAIINAEKAKKKAECEAAGRTNCDKQ